MLTWFIFYLQFGVTWITTEVFIGLVEANLEVELHVMGIVIFFNLILAYLITSSVFSVLKTTAETCVLCFVDDLVNHEKSGKPFYSSKNLIFGLTLMEVKDSDTYLGLEKIKDNNTHLKYIKVNVLFVIMVCHIFRTFKIGNFERYCVKKIEYLEYCCLKC